MIKPYRLKKYMSSKIKKGLSGFSLNPDFTGCSSNQTIEQSGPPSILRQQIENELRGIPIRDQVKVLQSLLLLLGDERDTSSKDDVWEGR